jgi:hypothetical protein
MNLSRSLTTASLASTASAAARRSLFVTAAALALALTACGGEEKTDDADSTPDVSTDTAVDTADTQDDTPVVPDATADSEGAGPDGSTTEVTDTSTDTGPKPQAPLAVGPGSASAICKDLCTEAFSDCSLAPVGGTIDACIATCKQKVATDGWWISNFMCYGASCDAELCQLAGKPLEGDESCDPLCEAFGDCELLELIEIPDNDVNACRAFCTGSIAGDAPTVESFPCVGAALAKNCSIEELGKCLVHEPDLVGDICNVVCDPLFDDTATNTAYCEESSALRAAWPNVDACVAVCTGLGDYNRAGRFSGCLAQTGCADPSVCTNPPATDDAACVTGCAAIGELCKDGPLALAPATCPNICTGTVLASGQPGDPGVATCLKQFETCPVDPVEQTSALFTCVRAKSPECNAVCDALLPCTGAAGLTKDACLANCTFGGYGEGAALAANAACMQKSPICTDVLKCLAPKQEDPVCEASCAHQTECELSPASDCVAACGQKLSVGQKTLATAMCEILSPCDDQEVCASLPQFEPPATCVAACDAAPNTCAAYADSCEVACMGALTGASLTVSSAPCVVEKLGVTCDVEALTACK